MLFMTRLYTVFNLGIRYFHVVESLSDSLQSSQRVASMFLIPTLKELRRRGERNLASGAASTLYIQTGPPAACMFLSAQPPGTVFQTDTSGNLLYQGWLCLYADATNSTLRLSDLYNDGTLLTATVPTSRPSFATMLALP